MSAVRVRTSIAWLMGSAVWARTIGALTSVLTARALGADRRGELAVLTVVGLLAGAVMTTGIDMWAARAVAQNVERRAIVSLIRRHQAVSAGAAATVAVSIAVLSDHGWTSSTAAALLGWATAGSTLKLGLLLGANETRSYGASTAFSYAVYGCAVLALFLGGSDSVAWFLLAGAAARVVTAVWPFRTDGAREATRNVRYMDALRFGATSMLGGLVTFALYRLDVALVAWWLSPADAGLYSVALGVAELLWVLPNSAAQAVVPRVSERDPTVDTARICRAMVVLTLILGCALVAVGWFAVPVVFGDEFTDAVQALPGLALASVPIGVWKLLSHDLLGRGDPHTRLVSGVAGVVVLVAFDAAFVPSYGLPAAAFGCLVGYAAAAAWCAQRWRQATGTGFRHLVVPERGDFRLRRARGRMPGTPIDASEGTRGSLL